MIKYLSYWWWGDTDIDEFEESTEVLRLVAVITSHVSAEETDENFIYAVEFRKGDKVIR